ncbi:MAG: MerR family transcriptional regulator, partial [Pseudomonadota bacterium]
MNLKTFTTRQICRKLGIKERALIHWAEKHFIIPLQDAAGYPSRRLYSAKNLLEIGLINYLWGKVGNRAI